MTDTASPMIWPYQQTSIDNARKLAAAITADDPHAAIIAYFRDLNPATDCTKDNAFAYAAGGSGVAIRRLLAIIDNLTGAHDG